MIKFFSYLFLFVGFNIWAQNEQLALDYFDNGEYNKAVTLYEELYSKQPSNINFDRLLGCYQQLEQFDKAVDLIDKEKKRSRNVSPKLIIEEGYLYQLTNNQEKADEKYNEALQKIYENASYAYTLGSVFQNKTLLDWAVKAYTLGQQENPNLNFDYQLALLSGQMGDLQGMIDKLLDYAYGKPERVDMVKNYLTSFLMNDADEVFLNDLRKSLIIRVQKTPDIFWNQFLSWFYIQQKEYGKAFVQEKAVYKRNPESLVDIISLGYMAIADEQYESAQSIFEFVLENSTDRNVQYSADFALIKIKVDTSSEEENVAIKNQLDTLLQKYEVSPITLDLYLLSAHFECFNLGNSQQAITLLNSVLDKKLNARDASKVKLELADILLYNEKFNQSILYYAQVEDNMKNDEMAHEASMKMAKANYYKEDFEWAMKQVKVLKQSASFLIANDALELFLLINDNTAEDSLQSALKAYSKADFKLYQNKKQEALQDFLSILNQYKGDTIEDETLLKIGQIYTQQKDYAKAIEYYEILLKDFPESVFLDDALYYSAELYNKQLENLEKAKENYEKIIFNHQDSIFFTEARRQYRILRGDTNI